MEKLGDVWGVRDLPVLLAAARMFEDQERRPPFQVAEIAQEAGLPGESVSRALAGLVPSYLGGEYVPSFGSPEWIVRSLTERGRRAVGLWPSGEGLDALVDTLRKAEDSTSDPEEKKLLQRAAGALGSVSREVMADVIAAFVRQQAGL